MPDYQTIAEIRSYNSGFSACMDGRKEEDCTLKGVELSAWLAGFGDAKEDNHYKQFETE